MSSPSRAIIRLEARSFPRLTWRESLPCPGCCKIYSSRCPAFCVRIRQTADSLRSRLVAQREGADLESVRSLVCLVAVFALAGCATTEKLEEKVLAASPASDSGFLENPERMQPNPDRAPFDRYWLSP